ncbi:MAG: hypothetical protein QM736_29990 [Vicinamibacterales bacterium]
MDVALWVGDLDQTLEAGGHLHHGEPPGRLVVGRFEEDREVQAERRQAREGTEDVDCQRRENRQHAVAEVRGESGAPILGKLADAGDADAVGVERRQEETGREAIESIDEGVRADADGGELLLRRHAAEDPVPTPAHRRSP